MPSTAFPLFQAARARPRLLRRLALGRLLPPTILAETATRAFAGGRPLFPPPRLPRLRAKISITPICAIARAIAPSLPPPPSPHPGSGRLGPGPVTVSFSFDFHLPFPVPPGPIHEA